MNFTSFSKNGQILPIGQATIPLSNIEYQYGFGVYETLKVRNGILYFVEQHIERLLQSAEIIGLEHNFSYQFSVVSCRNLVNRLSVSQSDFSCNIKVLLIGGKTKDDAQLFMLPLAPHFPDRKLYTQGAKTITVRYERFLPGAKTLNMLPSYLAYSKAKKQGCYDALYRDHKNNILEGTRTNFFAVKDKTIFTAPKEKVLEGVTRQTVLYVAKQQGFTIEEWEIGLKQIIEGEYRGAFLTSTSSRIVPVKQIDDFVFTEIPESVRKLMKAYDLFLERSQGVFTTLT